MSKTDAAYMRAYRARKKAEAARNVDPVVGAAVEVTVNALLERITELNEEVRHLKEELAKRPSASLYETRTVVGDGPVMPPYERFRTRPFTPVPKKGK